MKNHLQKVLTVLLALVLLAGMAACNTTVTPAATSATQTESPAVASSEPPTEVPREPVKIKVLRGGDTARSSLDDEFGKILFEQFKTEIEFVPYNESHFEKALMLLSAQNWGDLDLINTALDDVTKKYIEANVLVNLDDYKVQLPNFYSYEADLIPYWRNLDTKNGNLYIWQAGPDQIQMTNPPLDIVTRVDALEACGWPELDTTDDYVAFLTEAMQKIPLSNGQKSIGMAFFYGDPVGPLLSTYLPRHSGYQHFYKTTGLVDVKSSTIVPLASNPYAKATASFYNTLWIEGIMDKEAWTDGFAECQAKMDSGVALTVNFMNWSLGGANLKAVERNHPEAQYIVTPIRLQIAKDEGQNVRYELYNSVRPDETFGILKTSKNIDRVVELINYCASLDVTKRLGWGTEGVDYTVDGNNQLVPTSDFVAKMQSADGGDYLTKQGMDGTYGQMFPCRLMGQMPNGQAGRYSVDPAFNKLSATETQKKAYAALGWADATSGWRDNKNFTFEPFDITKYIVASTLDPESAEAKSEEKIIQYMNTQLPLVITAPTKEEFESMYAVMVQKVSDLGIDAVIAKYNEQLKSVGTRIDELSKR